MVTKFNNMVFMGNNSTMALYYMDNNINQTSVIFLLYKQN